MKSSIHRHALALSFAAAAFVGGVAHAQDSTWEKFKTYTHTQKNEAIAEGKKLLAATDQKMAALAKEAKHSSADTKSAHDKNMAELAAKKKAAQAELARMEKAAANTWDATKEGASNAYRDLHQAYEKAAASHKK
jgi:hypothetical protein